MLCLRRDLEVVLGAFRSAFDLLLQGLLHPLQGGSLLDELGVRSAELGRILVDLGLERCFLEAQVLDESQRVHDALTAATRDRSAA